MKVEEAIRQRRSIRQYTEQVPKEDDIRKVLEAGIWAPSGLNNQPWKFKIVRDRQKDALAKFTKYGNIIKGAPIAVCVFLDNTVTYNREKDIMAIGACIQNMFLQAYELGLGACWLGEILNRKKEVERYLEIDADYELMAVLTVGFSDEEVTQGCRKVLKGFILK